MRVEFIQGKHFANLFLLLAFICALCAVWNFALDSSVENTLLTRPTPMAYTRGWSAETEEGERGLSEVSRTAAGRVGETLVLKNTLPPSLVGSTSLAFKTKNESVRVWVDGDLVYTYGEEPQRVYGHGVGAIYHFAPLPMNAAGRTVTVELVPIGGRTGLAPYEFMLGSRSDEISYLLWGSVAVIAVTLVLGLIGVTAFAMFIIWSGQKDSRAPAAFYFSLFVLLGTVWMASDSGLLQFLMPNKGVIYLLFGCSFYLLCAPLAMFMAVALPERKKLYQGFSIVTSAYALLRVLLYVTGAMDFEKGLWLLHLLMGVMLISVNLSMWLPAIREKKLSQPELFLAVSVFTAAEGISLVSFYLNDKLDMLRNGYSSGFYIGIFLFALIVVAGVVRRTQRLKQQAFKAEFLERRAYTDELTGLNNVKGFDDKCAELLCSLPEGRCCAVVDFDVNFFSQYNATNGLLAGDALLKKIGAGLSARCGQGELCARQEADHYVCLLLGDSLEDILERIERTDAKVRSRMTRNMLLLSYGVVEVTDRTLPVPALRNQAAVAKRTVKGNYEKNIAVYDRSLHESQLQEVVWLSGFEDSLKNNEYVIFLQPKIDVKSSCLGGAEALVRRIEPDGAVMSAGPIIEALEKKGFVTKLDYHVLELVCGFLRRCLAEGREVCPISSNFSRVHLYDQEFPARVAAIADSYGVPRELVEIELTETAFLVGKDVLQAMVRRLHDNGFKVAIDDFGSGYSSLNMLKDVEADAIKLDREFLTGFGVNRRADTIIAHTISLAQDMDITAVAEGIETAEQLEFLKTLGCGLVQGYFYSRPLPEEEFIEKYLPIKQ